MAELTLPTASCIYGITEIAIFTLQSARFIKSSRYSVGEIATTNHQVVPVTCASLFHN